MRDPGQLAGIFCVRSVFLKDSKVPLTSRTLVPLLKL
ncbi:MAG: hypothetical protein JWQ85_1117 [Mucilaginibacter sp.]|jgi:hypothetical protein|nr:hypothetical protein [Mucilaginibacter sp.]